MPISWKGALQQHGGRLHRDHATKTDVRIIDFVDTGHPALLRMWDRRQRGSRGMGYRMAEEFALNGETASLSLQPDEDQRLTGTDDHGTDDAVSTYCRHNPLSDLRCARHCNLSTAGSHREE